MLEGSSGYGVGSLTLDTSMYLTFEQWNAFVSLIDKAEFWTMENTNGDMGYDGATWLLEGVKRSEYKWVERWSPSNSFRQACEYLISTAPLNIDSNNIY